MIFDEATDCHQGQPETVCAAAGTAVHPAGSSEALQQTIDRAEWLTEGSRKIGGARLLVLLQNVQHRTSLADHLETAGVTFQIGGARWFRAFASERVAPASDNE